MARKTAPPAFVVRLGGPKYRAKRTEHAGVVYASKAEAAWAAYLDERIAAGVVDYVVRQPRFALGTPENVYVPDFHVVLGRRWGEHCSADDSESTIFHATGQRTFVDEVKGMETAKFKKDKVLWMRYGPCAMRIVKRGRVTEVLIPEKFQR